MGICILRHMSVFLSHFWETTILLLLFQELISFTVLLIKIWHTTKAYFFHILTIKTDNAFVRSNMVFYICLICLVLSRILRSGSGRGLTWMHGSCCGLEHSSGFSNGLLMALMMLNNNSAQLWLLMIQKKRSVRDKQRIVYEFFVHLFCTTH